MAGIFRDSQRGGSDHGQSGKAAHTPVMIASFRVMEMF